jgi:hypothetical protein
MDLRVCFFALLLTSALVPSVALAQVSEVSDSNKAAARQLTVDGFAALQRKDYAAAADLFKRADALYHAPTVTLGLARSLVGLGKLLAAQELYNRLIHEPLAPGASDAFVRAIDEGRAELAALSPRIPSLIVQVRGGVPARVTLDGAPVPAALLGVKQPVNPGRHTVRVVARGFAPAAAPVEVAEGNTATVALDLVPAPRGVSDGVDESAGDTGTSGRSPLRTVGFVAIGVGGAGLVAGAITLAVDAAKHSSLASQCTGGTCGPGLQGAVDTYHTLGVVSSTSLVVGGALAVTGIVLVFAAPKARQETVGLVPLLGPGFVGMGGRFQ